MVITRFELFQCILLLIFNFSQCIFKIFYFQFQCSLYMQFDVPIRQDYSRSIAFNLLVDDSRTVAPQRDNTEGTSTNRYLYELVQSIT